MTKKNKKNKNKNENKAKQTTDVLKNVMQDRKGKAARRTTYYLVRA